VKGETNVSDKKLGGERSNAGKVARFLVRVPAKETNGAYSVTEFLLNPGDSTFVHQQEKEDEYLLVLDGTAKILCGDKTFEAKAGTTVSLPRDVPHAWGNPTDAPLRVIITAVPGGCEEALQLIATHGDRLDLQEIGRKYAVKLVGPPMLGRR
jgi:quercetin dioxygenase-like cupin family protein